MRRDGLDGLVAGRARERLALDPPPSAEARRAFADEVREAPLRHGARSDGRRDDRRAARARRVARRRAPARGRADARGADRAARATCAGTRACPSTWRAARPTKRALRGRVHRGRAASRSRRVEELVPLYDFVWFTPRVDDLDPCDRFKRAAREDAEAGLSRLEPPLSGWARRGSSGPARRTRDRTPDSRAGASRGRGSSSRARASAGRNASGRSRGPRWYISAAVLWRFASPRGLLPRPDRDQAEPHELSRSANRAQAVRSSGRRAPWPSAESMRRA